MASSTADTAHTVTNIGRAYLAGGMSNIPGFAFRQFDAVAAELRHRGIDVVTPSELDDPRTRKAALRSKDGNSERYLKATGLTRGKLLSRDICIIIDNVDCVVVLPGWRRSPGARLETYTAWLHGKPVYYYPTLRRVPLASLMGAWMGRGAK